MRTSILKSPWSNVISERHNTIITEILLKVEEDCNCNWETVKNSSMNVNGFSPHQIVFSKNIQIPSKEIFQKTKFS